MGAIPDNEPSSSMNKTSFLPTINKINVMPYMSESNNDPEDIALYEGKISPKMRLDKTAMKSSKTKLHKVISS